MDLFELLLSDRDGDGLLDHLNGKVFLPEGAGIDTVCAASEVIARLASRAVVLLPATASWRLDTPGFYLGRYPPRSLRTSHGFEVVVRKRGIAVVARTEGELLRGCRWFATSSYLFAPLLNALPSRLLLREGKVRLEFPYEISEPDWSGVPQDPVEIRAAGTLYVRPGVDEHAVTAQATTPEPTPAYFSLGTALQGGGLYTGSSEQPEILRGKVHLSHPLPEAVSVAARLSTEGIKTRLPVTGELSESRVRLMLDDTLASGMGEIRTTSQKQESLLEIAGRDKEDLAHTARYFAESFPRLPDGTLLGELEDNLKHFLHGRTRLGRLASVAALHAVLPTQGRLALLPSPPPPSPKLLGLPVKNTVRDGERTRWQKTFCWEGTRLLDAVANLDLDSHDEIQIVAFLSEDRDIRERLAADITATFSERGTAAEVTIHCAYKPGLHWLLEHIAPRAFDLEAASIEIRCATHKHGVEVADRWLRELYPAAEVLESGHPDLKIDLSIDEGQERTYLAVVKNAAGEILFEQTLDPPTAEKPYLGIEGGPRANPTTGALQILEGGTLREDVPLPTDRDLAWDWYTGTVLPELAVAGDDGSYFTDLAINFSASEPEHYLGVDHETCSAVEAMHEEFYFGTLEALNQQLGRSLRDRAITPGWILPFCKNRPEQDTTVRVESRGPGSYRLGIEDVQGVFHEVPAHHAEVEARVLRLKRDQVPHLTIDVRADSPGAAAFFERKLRWLQTNLPALNFAVPLPSGVSLKVNISTAAGHLAQLTLPAIDGRRARKLDLTKTVALGPMEVFEQARAFAQDHRAVHCRPVRETRLGAPLISLEASWPSVPAASRARLSRWKPTVLISARQHANEPTSTNANFLWLARALRQKELLNRFNIVFHPIENPDGARLYQALLRLSPTHMHHAARYTSLGTDVQATITTGGQALPERQLLEDAQKRWSPLLHLNNHGYPAHEWTRPHSGYVPAHFADWSLPFGYLSILILEPDVQTMGGPLMQAIAAALGENAPLASYTSAQLERNLRYRSEKQLPFSFTASFPFMLRVRDAKDTPLTRTTARWLTVISEVPDESVEGELWHRCVLAHQLINQAVLKTLDEMLNRAVWEEMDRLGDDLIVTTRCDMGLAGPGLAEIVGR